MKTRIGQIPDAWIGRGSVSRTMSRGPRTLDNARQVMQSLAHLEPPADVRPGRVDRLREELERAYAQRLLDDQRRALARELHDGVAQMLFTIQLIARQALSHDPSAGQPVVLAPALAQIGELAHAGSAQLRQATSALDRAAVDLCDPVPALAQLVEDFRARSGVDADLVVTATRRQLPAGVAETLHVLLWEALANVEQHSNARAVLVCLRIRTRHVTLSIQDDGASPSSPVLPARRALRRVGARIRHLRGTLVAEFAPDGGFRVQARLPLPRRRLPVAPAAR